ncbi:MAG: hypothetical protein J6I49_01270 [Bacteroidales bacterium]|nr:hypothetical protein [Bacteroidales bacterium]
MKKQANGNDQKNNQNKKEQILKGAAYGAAVGVGALGAMAFTTDPAEPQPEDTPAEAEPTPAPAPHGNTHKSSVGLTEQQREELKAELREEIRQELLHDEEFIKEVNDNHAPTTAESGEHSAETNDSGNPTPQHPISEQQTPPHQQQSEADAGSEVEVIAVHTETLEDGSMIDMAELRSGNDDYILVDTDRDGTADYLVYDVNHNHAIDNNDEVSDIRGENIAMPNAQGSSQEDSVEVIDVKTVETEDGSQMNVATLRIEDNHLQMYDVDQDGYADFLAVDDNHNMIIDEGDRLYDVRDEHMAMPDHPGDTDFIS